MNVTASEGCQILVILEKIFFSFEVTQYDSFLQACNYVQFMSVLLIVIVSQTLEFLCLLLFADRNLVASCWITTATSLFLKIQMRFMNFMWYSIKHSVIFFMTLSHSFV